MKNQKIGLDFFHKTIIVSVRECHRARALRGGPVKGRRPPVFIGYFGVLWARKSFALTGFLFARSAKGLLRCKATMQQECGSN